MKDINYKLLFDVMIRVAREKNLHIDKINELRLSKFEINNNSFFNKKKECNILLHFEENVEINKCKFEILEDKIFRIYNKEKKQNEFVYFDYIIITAFNIYFINLKNYQNIKYTHNHFEVNGLSISSFDNDMNSSILNIISNFGFKEKFNFIPKIRNIFIFKEKVEKKDCYIESEFFELFLKKTIHHNNILQEYKKIKEKFDNSYLIKLPKILDNVLNKDSSVVNDFLKINRKLDLLKLTEGFAKKYDDDYEYEIIDNIKDILLKNIVKRDLKSFISTFGLTESVNNVITIYNHRMNNPKSDINIIKRINNIIKDESHIDIIKKSSNPIKLKLLSMSGTYLDLDNEKKEDFILHLMKYPKNIRIILDFLEYNIKDNKFYIKEDAYHMINISKKRIGSFNEILFIGKNHNATEFKIDTLYFENIESGEEYLLTLNYGINKVQNFEHIFKLIIKDKVSLFCTNIEYIEGRYIKILKELKGYNDSM